MSIYDRLDNKVRNFKSRSDEINKVASIRKEMEQKNKEIEEQINLIGRFYWKKYYEGNYDPGEDLPYFEAIDQCNEELKYLAKRIDDCKVLGYVERNTIDEATEHRISERKALAETRRIQRAEDREKRRKEREDKARLKAQEKLAKLEAMSSSDVSDPKT